LPALATATAATGEGQGGGGGGGGEKVGGGGGEGNNGTRQEEEEAEEEKSKASVLAVTQHVDEEVVGVTRQVERERGEEVHFTRLEAFGTKEFWYIVVSLDSSCGCCCC